MKILFVTHDLDYGDRISISYLSAVAKELGHDTSFCTIEPERFCKKGLLDSIVEYRPDIIAYSIDVTGFERAKKFNRLAQEKRDFISIMGGAHPTFAPETFIESGVDAYCIGEGEEAFADFLIRVSAGMSYDDVPNLITRKSKNEVRPLIENLDAIPIPDRDLVLSMSGLKGVAKKSFATTRGCYFNCNYCYNSYYQKLYHGKGKYVRRFPVERTIREMEDVRSRYRMDFVRIGDDCFAIKADDWLREFAEQYKNRIGIPFSCYLRIDRISDELLSWLKYAGCYSVIMSIDSVSPQVRETVLGRKMPKDNEKVREALRLVRQHGIHSFVNFMLAAPTSTLQDDLDTIEWGREATYLSYSTTVPTKGTRLYALCLEMGMPECDIPLREAAARSRLPFFSEKEKDIRYNVLLLGPMIAKLPKFLEPLGLFLIKHTRPNWFYKKARDAYRKYMIENEIFIVKE